MMLKTAIFCLGLITGLGVYHLTQKYNTADLGKKESHAGTITPAFKDADYTRYETIDEALKSGRPGMAVITGRLWNLEGYSLVEPDASLKLWRQYAFSHHDLKDMPHLELRDDSVIAIDIQAKHANGALVKLYGHLSFFDNYGDPEHRKLVLDRVDDIQVISGISATIEDLTLRADHYHGTVITLEGTLGDMQDSLSRNYSHWGVYASAEAQSSKNAELGLMIESITSQEHIRSQHSNAYSEYAKMKGTRVAITALYQRPFKDDGYAPAGRLITLHSIKGEDHH